MVLRPQKLRYTSISRWSESLAICTTDMANMGNLLVLKSDRDEVDSYLHVCNM